MYLCILLFVLFWEPLENKMVHLKGQSPQKEIKNMARLLCIPLFLQYVHTKC